MSKSSAFKNPFDVLEADSHGVSEAAEVPIEVEQALKKIAKKDAVTRGRGFGELVSALNSIKDDNMAGVSLQLSSRFVALFKKYHLAPEKSVRLAVARVTQLLLGAHDNPRTFLGPILKQFLPRWLLSMFDPVPEVARIQKSIFEAEFQPHKHKELCVRFTDLVLAELKALRASEGMKNLEDLVRNDLGGSDEDVAVSVDLLRVETIGVVTFMISKMDALPDDPYFTELSVVVAQNTYTLAHRVAIYRLYLTAYKRVNVLSLHSRIVKLVLSETSPVGMPLALECAVLLADKDKSFASGLCRMSLSAADLARFLANSPDATTQLRLLSILQSCPDFKPAEMIRTLISVLIGPLGLNFRRDAIIDTWAALVPELAGSAGDCDGLAEEILFPVSGSLPKFVLLSTEETVRAIVASFGEECVEAACLSRKPSWKAAYVCSFLRELKPLELVLAKLDADELMHPELAVRVPESLRMPVLEAKLGELEDAAELARLLSLVNEAMAVTICRRFVSDRAKLWVLLKGLPANLQTALLRDIPETVDLLASQSDAEAREFIRLGFSVPFSILPEAVLARLSEEQTALILDKTELSPLSPLVRQLLRLGRCLRHPKMIELLREGDVSDLRALVAGLNLSSDCSAFLELGISPEVSYPIEYLSGLCKEFVEGHSWSFVDALLGRWRSLFEGKNRECLEELLRRPIPANTALVRLLALAALGGRLDTTSIPIECLAEAFDKEEEPWFLWAEFQALSRHRECIASSETPSDLKSALRFHAHCSRSLNVQALSDCIFSDSDVGQERLSGIASAFCIDPAVALPTGLVLGLVFGLEEGLLLMFCAKQCSLTGTDRREFWQCLWRDRVSEALARCLDLDLRARVGVAFWPVLASPEVDILPLFKDSLVLAVLEGKQSVGLCRLFVLALPFLDPKPLFKEAAMILAASDFTPAILAARSALVTLYLDESLVSAQVQLQQLDVEDADVALLASIVYPFWEMDRDVGLLMGRNAIFLMETMLSWTEGCREEPLLLAACMRVFKELVLGGLMRWLSEEILLGLCFEDGVNTPSVNGAEGMDFLPSDQFSVSGLLGNVIYRWSALFPLIVGGVGSIKGCDALVEKLRRRECDRLKRTLRLESEDGKLVIRLKPILTSTTSTVSVMVTFAEEIKLSLRLHVPSEFPFEPVRVEGLERAGLPESKWRSALLSLQAALRTSSFDGNVVDAVRLWQTNALKLFQGLEECTVCYSVVHPSDRSLPGPSCKTCLRRFHASCLYKWFKSSGNATCPLCRSLF